MSTPLVRASDIAQMAGVSRAAVTQWRKRHSDFPAPKEAADTPSPLFDRTEIEQWLVDNGRGILLRRTETQGHRSIASRLMQHLQGRYAPGTAIKIAGVLVGVGGPIGPHDRRGRRARIRGRYRRERAGRGVG
jgi:predicted DNA-binding transcriptional regulator AlpA